MSAPHPPQVMDRHGLRPFHEPIVIANAVKQSMVPKYVDRHGLRPRDDAGVLRPRDDAGVLRPRDDAGVLRPRDDDTGSRSVCGSAPELETRDDEDVVTAIAASPKLLAMTNTARQSTRQGGFTLLELLVVMSLLSVIMIGLVSALRTMAQTESKIDQRLERLDEIRVARSFLQQTLTRVSAMKLDAPGATGKTIVPFIATPDSLTWIGILPARPNVGGRHFFRLALEDTSAGHELVLRFSPWKPDVIYSDWSGAESRVLIRAITQIKIQAQGLPPSGHDTAPAWPNGWQDGWPIADNLPDQVRLGLVDAQGDWPEWTIALHALPQSDSSFSRVSVGGGSIR